MTSHTPDIRNQTLAIVQASSVDQPAQSRLAVLALIDNWLNSLEQEDLSGLQPDSFAHLLLDGFGEMRKRTSGDCQIASLRYADGRGGWSTALLVLNNDKPFLVDSMVMTLRRLPMSTRAVFNTVLSVQRDAEGIVQRVARIDNGDDPLESYVMCLLSETLSEAELDGLIGALQLVAGDAAAVRNDAIAMLQKMTAVANAAANTDVEGREVAAFLDWARNEGFELFGYAYYRVVDNAEKLVRDSGRLGVLRDPRHPIYDTSLSGIPEDYDTLATRSHALSVVKADVPSTLHRDQQLDFIGVRDRDANGSVLGEHCFIGLFTRAATATPLLDLPFVRGRVNQVLHLAGVRQEGFRSEKFLEILESLPRTEILEADLSWLARVCGTAVSLYKQPRAKVFARRDIYGRHLNVLTYMPRERYSASMAAHLARELKQHVGASDVRWQTLVSDGPLARLYMIATAARSGLDMHIDVAQPLLAVIEGWHTAFNNLVDAASEPTFRIAMRKACAELPAEYVDLTTPVAAYRDLSGLLELVAAPRVSTFIEFGAGVSVNIRLLSIDSAPSLSQILPALHNTGLAIEREQAFSFNVPGSAGRQFHVTCLTVDAVSAARLGKPAIAEVAQDLFASLFNNEVEDGRMNGLVIEAGLRKREVQLIRAYASYWRQAGCRFSLRYMADCLRKQPEHVRTLVDSFLLRFDPASSATDATAGTARLSGLRRELDDVNHADTEDILRNLADLMLATLRTSYFQPAHAGDTIIFKFDSSQLALLPEPRPYREIYVFSQRFEGVHLRGGPVARGGLRWSDRMEDYRTEVLGLVKAQMVKNAVIVPAGAKGGFVCKGMARNASREQVAQEGEAVYRLFINGLLDITDNREQGQIVVPGHTVCYDEPDPYLVVAADKGTATFSDIANGIATARGFWLGDAFASGGSNGYDHKKLGITAKGAWEAVKRHFHEMGHDLATTPTTIVGVGDMSGDVFGNGVLLSRQLKLVAAFDHRHIFIDPNPDVGVSFAERERLFALPRSSWDDYDKALISTGGGVWPRSTRNIALSPQVQEALGTDVATATPEQLMHLILKAPVDLFYNGGIGTYIKAASESHAQVKDRANDLVRVDGGQLRCKVVAEGGNLGATQAGRIEFALHGGRIFTDAIDNSAGVDCSDHEVNVKIWLDTEVNAGTLSVADRNGILNQIAGDIEALVLRDNALQTHLLVREQQAQQQPAVQQGYAALIAHLEAEGIVSRELEQLPGEAELARRNSDGIGLALPELAVVIAHVKNRYKRILAAQPLTRNAWARALLAPYFPPALVATRDPLAHPLANAILATILANEVINRCGPLMVIDLAHAHLVKETDVINAWAQAWQALNLAPVFDTLDAHALDIPNALAMDLDRRTRRLQQSIIEGMLSVPEQQRTESGAMGELSTLFADAAQLQTVLASSARGGPCTISTVSDLPEGLMQAWQLVGTVDGIADFLFAALTVNRPVTVSLPALLETGLALRRQSGIAQLEQQLGAMVATATTAQEPLRQHALRSLRQAQQRLIVAVLASAQAGQCSLADALGNVMRQMQLAGPMQDGALPGMLEDLALAAWKLADTASLTGSAT